MVCLLNCDEKLLTRQYLQWQRKLKWQKQYW